MGDGLVFGIVNRLLNGFTKVSFYPGFVSIDLGRSIFWFKFPSTRLST